MPRIDWLPGVELKLVEVCEVWQAGLGNPQNVTAYGWKQTEVDETLIQIDGFLVARVAYKENNSSKNRLAKDDAKENAKHAMRNFANTSIRYNPLMRPEEKLVYGIRPTDNTMTPHPEPTVRPDIVVENTHNRFEHKIRAFSSENGKETKPTGVHGVRYGWQIGGEKPASGENLPKTKFSRKANYIITHTEADKGKAVYYAVCYENSSGDEGPWSPVEEAMIG
jgi:hypothetical protein